MISRVFLLFNGLRYLRMVAGAGKTVREAEAHHTSAARDVRPRLWGNNTTFQLRTIRVSQNQLGLE